MTESKNKDSDLPTRLITSREMREMIGMSARTFSRRRSQPGSLPPTHPIGSKLMYRVSDVLQWIEEQVEEEGSAERPEGRGEAHPSDGGKE